MKISLLTDAPRHNLALMKLSTHHKKAGDEVSLNMPLWPADYTYGSYILENSIRYGDQERGGIGAKPELRLPEHIDKLRPDYSLFSLRHSLGYTFRDCRRKCPFCKVKLLPRDRDHHSIWEFHEKEFNTIELLNNNTFYDPLWEDTFKEIYEAGLRVIDNGNDLRLLDDHRAWWIRRLTWVNQPKFAWDRMRDEKRILEGLKLLKKHRVRAMVYVLMGFDTGMQDNIHRCQRISDLGHDPFPMLYEPTPQLRAFRRMIYLRYYRRYRTIGDAWKNFDKEVRNWKRRGNWRKEVKAEKYQKTLDKLPR